ncbi:CPBP family intramembrane glutamic endopeptidase [Sutcliffiella rhizosphaerae]|uniref:CAAX prenyl protease 2/Lysostaphin resistance protein A-like domain-containing protein n=1 Tax=Sutcliffiella rhizosphaerae TaxID=2880967 RepID=A0ABN8AHI1_9BACI|nr:CPBP family intramembrane glutamic endopeptidase [Sutcliffiella rhizosphaerae]CAG9623749.1 hypothetical protein BACCIP111883_04581 [Sutcliffiella rhizosphaerae]
MISSSLLVCLFLLSLPGIVIFSMNLRDDTTPDKKNIPPLFTIISQLILLCIFIIVGSLLIRLINHHDAVFIDKWAEAFILGTICSIAHILIYYGVFKFYLPSDEFSKLEKHRNSIGIFTRVFYASVLEEIIFRWAALSFFYWVIHYFIEDPNITIWLAILISSIIFTASHYLGSAVIGNSKALYIYIFFGNMLVGVVCGWQFYSNGIGAAIIVHMCFHILLYPIELIVLKREKHNTNYVSK